MLRPTESPPASAAPRLAASIKPGPPPVMTVNPSCARQAAVSRQSSYQRWSSGTRAEPKIETPSSMSRSASKPRSTSAWIRSRRTSSSASTSPGTRSNRSSRSGDKEIVLQPPCEQVGHCGRAFVAQVQCVGLELADVGEASPELLDGLGVERRSSFALSQPCEANGQRRSKDREGNPAPGGVQGIPDRLEEPTRDDDPVHDGEVARLGIGCGGRGDDLHHSGILIVRLRLPRLDVAGADEAKEVVCFKVNRPGEAGKEGGSGRRLADPRRPGEDQDGNVVRHGSAPGGIRTRAARLKRPPL